MTTARQSTAWISVSEEAGSIVLRLGGELDLAACDTIGAAVMAAAENVASVDLDFADVTFCDSSGLALLINASAIASEHGHRFRVSRAQPQIVRLIEIANVQHLAEEASRTDP
jgi:anti-sigma B factor antagonist